MKVKTHSGTKKRVRTTANGKLKVNKAGKRHLLVQKSKRAKKMAGKNQDVPETRAHIIKKLLPNG